jgi:hypothetical protein
MSAMRVKALVVSICSAAAIVMLGVPAEANNMVTVGNGTITGCLTTAVTVDVDNLMDTNAFDAEIDFDPNVVSVSSCVGNSLISLCNPACNVPSPGVLKLVFACGATPVNGGGTMFTITFQGLTNGSSALNINNVVCSLAMNLPCCDFDDVACAAAADGMVTVGGCPTPTATNTPTDTPTLSPTSTPTDTSTPTSTPTGTPTRTPSNTPTDTATRTPSNTPTETGTPTNTPTITDTPTVTPTRTPSNTPTETGTPTNTPTITDTPTQTPTSPPTDTPTVTPTRTNTPTASNTPTVTETPTQTATSPPTNTPTTTNTPSPTSTPTPMPPEITGGAVAGSTTVTGRAIPNATPGNNCITVFDCGTDGICSTSDTPIGTGSVNAQGVYVVTVSPPLAAGERIFARDTCNDLNGPPVVVGAGTVAPVMSMTMVIVLAFALGAVGLLAVGRMRMTQGRG